MKAPFASRFLLAFRWMVCSLALMACGSKAEDSKKPPASPVDEALDKLADFKNKACACKDKACADKIDAEMDDWNRAHKDVTNIKPTDEQQLRVMKLSNEMFQCQVALEKASG